MFIKVTKLNLIKSINIVIKAISNRTTLPILECIVIKTVANEIKLIANDMEIGIETTLDGEILEDGSIAINSKLFFDIVRKLNREEVTIKTDENYKATIKCGKSVFNISGQSIEEFPTIPNIEKSKHIQLSQFTLKEMIRQTIFSISNNENMKMLTGELLEVNNNKFRIIALDGLRISIRKTELLQSNGNFKSIVPGKTLNEISKILSNEVSENVDIYFSEKYILFEFNKTIVTSRLIEGEFYNVDQMFSNDYESKITINRKDFHENLDSTLPFISEKDRQPVLLDIKNDLIDISIKSNIGKMNTEMDIKKDGKNILIAFNPNFLLDAIKVIEDEELDIYLFNPKAPCIIRNENDTYVYIVLPVNFNADNY